MTSDRKTTSSREIAKLLLSGATMLDEACPDCHVPLFKKEKKIFCPSCKREAVFVKPDQDVATVEAIFQTKQISTTVFAGIKPILYGKLEFFSQKIAGSENPKEINEYLKVVQNIMDTLQQINRELKE